MKASKKSLFSITYSVSFERVTYTKVYPTSKIEKHDKEILF